MNDDQHAGSSGNEQVGLSDPNKKKKSYVEEFEEQYKGFHDMWNQTAQARHRRNVNFAESPCSLPSGILAPNLSLPVQASGNLSLVCCFEDTVLHSLVCYDFDSRVVTCSIIRQDD